MKVLCIDYSIYRCLIPGKWYEVIKEDERDYLIIDDRGYENWYRKSWFKTQQEVREEKLGELGL